MHSFAAWLLLFGLLPGFALRGQNTSTAATQPSSQASTASAEQLTELKNRLKKSHCGDQVPAVDSFRAKIQVTTLGRSEDSVSGKLEVAYFDPKQLIRYRLEQSGYPVEHWRDRQGRMWGKGDKETYSLGEAIYEKDRTTLKRNIQLARQLLRFLNPSLWIDQLQSPSPVVAAPLTMGRRQTIACRAIEGIVEDMPMYHGGERGRARVRLWIADDTGLLTALRITPLGPGDQPATESEFVYLQSFQLRDGLQLPNVLLFSVLTGNPQAPQRDVVEVRIDDLRLNPGLKLEDFDR